jgi:hypothetical protein
VIKIPGPNSAPNGDRSLVHGWTTIKHRNDDDTVWVESVTVREKLRRQHKMHSGKTAAKRRK